MEGFKSHRQNNFLTTLGASGFDDVANQQAFLDDAYSLLISVMFDDVVEKGGDIKKDGFRFLWKVLDREYFLQGVALFTILDIYNEALQWRRLALVVSEEVETNDIVSYYPFKIIKMCALHYVYYQYHKHIFYPKNTQKQGSLLPNPTHTNTVFLHDYKIEQKTIISIKLNELYMQQEYFRLYKLYFVKRMGCEQSDVQPFLNALAGESQPSAQNVPQQRRHQQPPPQQVYQYPPQQVYQSHPQQHYHAQAQKVGQAPPSQLAIPGGSKKKRKIEQRERLEPQVNFDDDFLTHHLKYELSLTKLTSMKKIKRRQLVEHLMLQVYWGNFGGVKDLNIGFQSYQESLISSWIQRSFLDIWEVAHDDLFVKHLEEKIVRRKVSQQFMFELYELKEYVDSGLSSISFMVDRTQTNLFSFVQSSDDALFNLFKKLKDRYPQTSQTNEKIDFPDVPSTKTNLNLLDNFPCLSFSDPANMNYQTIYEDINFLLKKAIEEQDAFKEDMKDILGDDVLACPKVMQVTRDGKTSFNACAVRRVFVKWAENLLEKCPDLKFTKTFMKFIKARGQIVNNFFFKSTIQPTTHKIVIDCISLLLELAKFGLKDRKRRSEFIFNIYDLLRCKIKRNTPQQIVELLEKMKSTKTTKNGRKFQVLRVKNRFKTNNRDLLINFRYGNQLVGEAQLCIDNANVSKQAKLNYEFCHYIYELERSLFGPTLELMMQYEDYQRPDITVSFEAEDVVPARRDEGINNAGPVQRKCLQGHDMISLVGNFFFPPQKADETEEETIGAEYQSICNYCDRQSTVQSPYDYCYQCGCYLCKQCTQEYQSANTKSFWLSIQREELLPVVKNFGELQSLCSKNKSMIVLFWLENSSASVLFKDCIIYHQGKLSMQPGKYLPKLAQAKYTKSAQFDDLARRFGIKEYPTLILYDAQAKPVRTVIGYSWFEAPNLYMTQKLLIQEKSLDLDIYCAGCSEKMAGDAIRENSVCLNCFGTCKPVNLNPQLEGYGAYCSQGHYRCMNCCYASLQCPSTYRDGLGQGYLSTSWTDPKLPKCPKGHQTTLNRSDPKDNWQFSCFKCQKKKLFDNEHGVGQCTQCNVYACANCIGANIPTFNQLFGISNLVRHYVESTAQQACLCVCSRHFKKAYCSRVHSIEEIDQEHNKLWTCFLCRKQGKDGQLHMACFACPALSQAIGSKFNFEICLPCASKAKMLMREPEEKIQEAPSLFKCPKDNSPLVQTSFAYNKKLVVKCFYCSKNYFGNTQRFYCKSCDISCCMNCREKLWKGKPPKCKQSCPEGDSMEFTFVNPKSLEFCDGCMSVLRDQCFKCKAHDYSLCKECVSTQPPGFIGKALSKAREAVGGQFNKEEVQEAEEEQGQDYYGVHPGYQNEKEESEGFNIVDAFNDLW